MLSRKLWPNSATEIRNNLDPVLLDSELQATEQAFANVISEAEQLYSADGTTGEALAEVNIGQAKSTDSSDSQMVRGQAQSSAALDRSYVSVHMPPSRAAIAKAVFNDASVWTPNTQAHAAQAAHAAHAVTADYLAPYTNGAWYDAAQANRGESYAQLEGDEAYSLAAVDERALQNYAYQQEEDEQESFERLLRMQFPEESAAVSASADDANAATASQSIAALPRAHRVPAPTAFPRSFNQAPASGSTPAMSSGGLFVLNARASTGRAAIASSLARDFVAMGITGQRAGAGAVNATKANSSLSTGVVTAGNVAKRPAALAYGERLKQRSLERKAQVQSAPYVAVNSEEISGATKITVNSMAQHLSAHLHPETKSAAQKEEISTVVTTTEPPLEGKSATPDPEVTQKELEKAAVASHAVRMVTAHAAAEEQANVKALSNSADPMAAAIEQALLHPMSTKVAILDAVAMAPQREQMRDSAANRLGASDASRASGRSVVYSASECGSEPVLSSVSPQVAVAVAAIAAEEQLREQKAAQLSSEIVRSITAKGHTVVTGHLSVPLDNETKDDANDSASSDSSRSGSGSAVRIVRNQSNAAFVPSMEGVVSTDMSRRVRSHGALVALGLRSSLNEAAATALGLDVSSQLFSQKPAAPARGMVNGSSIVNGTKLSASAMHASLSPLNSEGGAERAMHHSGSHDGNATAATVASWAESWMLKPTMDPLGQRSDFSTATSRAALAAMQSDEALASLQKSLSSEHNPDLIQSEVLVQNGSTCIVTNSRRAKEDYRVGAQIVEAELQQERLQQAQQEQQPATVISQYDVLVRAPTKEQPAEESVSTPEKSEVAEPQEQPATSEIPEAEAPAVEAEATKAEPAPAQEAAEPAPVVEAAAVADKEADDSDSVEHMDASAILSPNILRPEEKAKPKTESSASKAKKDDATVEGDSAEATAATTSSTGRKTRSRSKTTTSKPRKSATTRSSRKSK